MTTLDAVAVAELVEQDWRNGEEHGITCTCCARADGDHPDLRVKLWQEAEYLASRFRPGEGYWSDETDDSLDELVDRMVAEGKRVVHATYTRMLSEHLAGKVVAA